MKYEMSFSVELRTGTEWKHRPGAGLNSGRHQSCYSKSDVLIHSWRRRLTTGTSDGLAPDQKPSTARSNTLKRATSPYFVQMCNSCNRALFTLAHDLYGLHKPHF